MNAQPLFKQGKTSANVLALLERIQLADPSSPDIDEDNLGLSWGHYQFTAGNLSPSSTLTSWQEIGSVTIAFKFVAAAVTDWTALTSFCRLSLGLHYSLSHLIPIIACVYFVI
jgi:hypothetical protein